VIARNVGGLDRAVRLAAGFILLPVGLFLLQPGQDIRWIAIVLGLAGLVTGLSGFCALYIPFGFSTRQTSR
jgi:hypothetical protein